MHKIILLPKSNFKRTQNVYGQNKESLFSMFFVEKLCWGCGWYHPGEGWFADVRAWWSCGWGVGHGCAAGCVHAGAGVIAVAVV